MINLLGLTTFLLWGLGVAFHFMVARNSVERWTRFWGIFGAIPLTIGWFFILVMWNSLDNVRTIGEALGSLMSIYAMSLIFGGAIYWFLRRKFNLFRSSEKRGKIIRGAKLMTEKQLVSSLAKEQAVAKIGNVPVPVRVENRNFLIAGSVGTGKSQTFYQVLDSVRARGQAALVADVSGDFVARYYRPGKDVILNPLEERGVNWSPFAEMEQPYDAVNLARAFIPEGIGADEKQWNGYARTVVQAILKKLFLAGLQTNQDLANALFGLKMKELEEFTQGTPAAAQFDRDAAKMFAAIRAIIAKFFDAYSYLDPAAGAGAFSITKFIQGAVNSADAPWIFLTSNENSLTLLQPMIGSQIDIASRAVMSQQPDESRRFWFSLDEFPSLGYVDSIEDLYTKGRKFGAAAIIGIQAVSQIRRTYGNERAQTIMATADTWVLLRNKDAESAEFMARQIGTNELKRTVYNSNASETLKVSQGQAEQYNDNNRLVLPSEIQSLPDRHCYLNIGGRWGKTIIPINHRQATQPHYQPKQTIREIAVGKNDEGLRRAIEGTLPVDPTQDFDLTSI